MVLPIMRDVFLPLDLKEFISVQPMTGPVSTIFKWESIDENNPKVGQIFHDTPKDDDPGRGCCLRSMWHKIWTGTEWIFERNISQEEWKSVIAKFHSKK